MFSAVRALDSHARALEKDIEYETHSRIGRIAHDDFARTIPSFNGAPEVSGLASLLHYNATAAQLN